MSDVAAGIVDAETTVLAGGRVFDGTAFLDGPHDVVFAGGEVAAVVPSGSAQPGPAASVIDVSGKTVLPGLIDAHVHVLSAGAGGLDRLSEPFSYPMYQATRHLRDTLAIGITTARDAGGADLGLKKAVADGLVSGPRLKIAVNIMSQTGGHGDPLAPSGIELPLFFRHPGVPSGIADGVEEVRKVARTLLRAGADQLKICSTGGVLSPSDDPRHSQFTPAEIEVIVEEAEAQGGYVMAHAQGAAGIKNALRAGVRSIEHGIYLDDEALGLLIDNDAYLVPTLVAPLSVSRAAARGVAIPPAVLAKAELVAADHRASIQRAIEAGVKIAMGTDSGVGPHGENLEELDQLWRLGMGLEGVLAASTSVAGELVAPDERVGCLKPGYTADAVVLDTVLNDGAQLAGIRESIGAVYQGGVRVV